MRINDKGKKRHDTVLREKFGIGFNQYQIMYNEQCGGCFLCGKKEQRNLAVDHNHITGMVRRLLCGPCNQALGLFKDNPDVLRKAAEYVETKFKLPDDEPIAMKAYCNRARWRNKVHTPNGYFNSFEEAGKHYNVHPTTIGCWCGAYKHKPHLKKDGFLFEKVFE